jgi:CheY-like chemotaxis protein
MSTHHVGIGRVLLVEGNDVMRSVAAEQLRQSGAGDVVSVSRITSAREKLEAEHFDLVMCSREFSDQEESGQDLLDELRRENLLAADTVFIMVASEATYQTVAEAGESSIDSFIVRPYTTTTLIERLTEATKRRRTLSPIFSAMNQGEHGVAFTRALMRFQEGQTYGLYCGRLAAEMLLRFQRPEDSLRLFQRIAERYENPWARLGIARAQSACGDLTAAKVTIEQLQKQDPRYPDAHELLGQVLIEHGELNTALQHCVQAYELTPGCVMRAQIAATTSFFIAGSAQALPLLERTSRMGSRSRLFNPLTWVLLAMARLDAKDSKGVAAAQQSLAYWVQRSTATPQTDYFTRVMHVLQLLVRQDTAKAVTSAREISLLADHDEFDLEAATVLMSLWARLSPEAWPLEQRVGIVQSLGLRLGVSKAASELMCAAARDQEPIKAALRQAQSSIALYSQRAVERSMTKDVRGAILQLLEHAETTRNSKLFELAGLTLKRRGSGLTDLTALTERAAQGLILHAKGVSHIAGVQRPGRSAAGMPLRGWDQMSTVKALLPALDTVDAAIAQSRQRESIQIPAAKGSTAVA